MESNYLLKGNQREQRELSEHQVSEAGPAKLWEMTQDDNGCFSSAPSGNQAGRDPPSWHFKVFFVPMFLMKTNDLPDGKDWMSTVQRKPRSCIGDPIHVAASKDEELPVPAAKTCASHWKAWGLTKEGRSEQPLPLRRRANPQVNSTAETARMLGPTRDRPSAASNLGCDPGAFSSLYTSVSSPGNTGW